ncbi:hypothetical protein FB446DRAFT_812091 [Lentinula raphanica]|nr:hypothetical protein FB446DRAFT_812091 [Lentinula raphanica]
MSLQSTPQKHSSASRSTSTTRLRKQDDLEKLLQSEVSNQIWEFDAADVARMLSPKKLKSSFPSSSEYGRSVDDPLKPPSLDNFHILVDDADVQQAFKEYLESHTLSYNPIQNTGELAHYDNLVVFLNDCVQAANNIYCTVLESHRQSRSESQFLLAEMKEKYWPLLVFHKYNKDMGDGIDGAAPLKPDIAGTGTKVRPSTCYWKLPSDVSEQDQSRVAIKIAVEVKADWPKLLWQSATYGRAEMATIPLRSFSLVIAINHIKHDLRFLIFHHGGITATKALSLRDDDDRNKICLVMMSIIFWQTPADAGIPSFTDGTTFILPPLAQNDKDLSGYAEIEEVIHQSHSIRGRNTWVSSAGIVGLSHHSIVKTQSTLEDLSRHHLKDPKPRSQQSKTEEALKSGSRTGMGTRTRSHAQQQNAAVSEKSRNHKQGSHALEQTQNRMANAVQPHKFHNMGAKFTMPSWKLTPGNLHEWSQISTGVLKGSWMYTEKISLEGHMLKACSGQFGSPDHIISFESCFEDGSPISNSIFLPSAKDKFEETLWNWQNKAHMPLPTKVDQRTLCFSLTKDRGETLEYCTDAMEILECILHSMLGENAPLKLISAQPSSISGWLSLYQNGFLHRDISIGNIIKLKSPSARKDFSALSVNKLLFQPPNSSLTSFETMRAAAGNDQARISILDLAQEVDKQAKKLTSGQMCKAIWIDGDMGADMSGYFKRSHDGTISGTYEFISQRLLDAVDDRLHYVHSPADDIESFFWVGLWSTLRNKNFSRIFTTEQRYAASLATGSTSREATASQIKLKSSFIAASRKQKEPYSDLFCTMAPVLGDWFTAINQLRFAVELENRDEEEEEDGEGHDIDPHLEEKLMLRFHRFAYRGVLDFMEIFEKHREHLQKMRV